MTSMLEALGSLSEFKGLLRRKLYSPKTLTLAPNKEGFGVRSV